MSVENQENVIGRIQEILDSVGTEKAQLMVNNMLVKAAEYSAIYTPVANSILINSQFRRIEDNGGKIIGEIGYGADYAVYVHEAPGKLKGLGVYRYPKRLGIVWSPNGEPQFLEKGVNEMLQEDSQEIIDRVMYE